ncbi:MAG: DeoR family transcriptional regulator [Candidatus Paceibacterota bacterium]
MESNYSKEFKANYNNGTEIKPDIFLNDGYEYLIKKTERLVAAMHLVTNHLSDKESLKWKIRSEGIDLLSLIMSFTKTSDHVDIKKRVLENFNNTLIFFDIAFVSKIISEVNLNILKNEFNLVSNIVSKLKSTDFNRELTLSSDFFFAEKDNKEINKNFNSVPALKNDEKTIEIKAIKPDFTHKIKPINNKNYGDDTPLLSKDEYQKNSPQNRRKEVIVSILKTKGSLSIKDIAILFNDCSEKTIQRELLSLVNQGFLKKEGERRWSKYSII